MPMGEWKYNMHRGQQQFCLSNFYKMLALIISHWNCCVLLKLPYCCSTQLLCTWDTFRLVKCVSGNIFQSQHSFSDENLILLLKFGQIQICTLDWLSGILQAIIYRIILFPYYLIFRYRIRNNVLMLIYIGLYFC